MVVNRSGDRLAGGGNKHLASRLVYDLALGTQVTDRIQFEITNVAIVG